MKDEKNIPTIPHLRELNGRKALYVDGKPLILLGLQWNCEYCYSPEVMDPLFKPAVELGLNAASLLLYWNEVEPEEGRYDFTMLDHRIEMCRKYGLKMILVWFGAYKNCSLNYAPDYVKQDHERFPKVVIKSGTLHTNFACPGGVETQRRDELALIKIFEHLKEVDSREHTVVLFQMENEVGFIDTDRCYCPSCNKRYEESGFTGKYGWYSDEAFGAYMLAQYCDTLAATCKAIYPIPIYMNVPLDVCNEVNVPGFTNFSGAPIARVLDIYKETQNSIDFIAPDIYQFSYRDWHHFCKVYTSENNPLFVAECATGAGTRTEKNVFYTLGEYAAIGFDGWAIDCAYPKMTDRPLVSPVDLRLSSEAYELRNSYMAVRNAMYPIIMAQNTCNIRTFVQEDGDTGQLFRFNEDIYAEIKFDSPWGKARGFVIRLSEKEFVLTGCFFSARFSYRNGTKIPFKKLQYGFYEGEKWVPYQNVRREQEDRSLSFYVRESETIYAELDI